MVVFGPLLRDLFIIIVVYGLSFNLTPVQAQPAGDDSEVAAFYEDHPNDLMWFGAQGTLRRQVFFAFLARATDHGLPATRYGLQELQQAADVAQEGDLPMLDRAITRSYVAYVQDVGQGVLAGQPLEGALHRPVRAHETQKALMVLRYGNLARFLAEAPPQTLTYQYLLKAKAALEQESMVAGHDPAPDAGILRLGDHGPKVVVLRRHLGRMGYVPDQADPHFDAALEQAVMQFQRDQGLEPDGIFGPATLAQMNMGAHQRLQSVLVALERERWMNFNRGTRHVWVNLADYTVKIIDDGRDVFSTRAVIGKNEEGHRTPEFSDALEYMVVNPSWAVPRSIITREYLPKLQRNPYAVRHIHLVNRRGQVVDRGSVDFGTYTAANFPFFMREPPSGKNALGVVKFMMPNRWNIYLHDTPSKSLFNRAQRAFSHGCIRLGDPQGFARMLLGFQSADPDGVFAKALAKGKERQIMLRDPVPVHIVYMTAFPDDHGVMTYRHDIYGRDGRIYEALQKAGGGIGVASGVKEVTQ